MRNNSNGRNGKLNVWFMETERFSAAWNGLRLSPDDFFAMQDLIKWDPTLQPVISGTNGLRKMRFAPPSRGRGKRGALRVCYTYIPRFSAVVLVLVFPKNEKVDLLPAEKKAIKSLLKRLEADLERRFGN